MDHVVGDRVLLRPCLEVDPRAAGAGDDDVPDGGPADVAVDVGADAGLGSAYVEQADWDPRLSPGYLFLVLRPVRVQAWREADEIAGRSLMRDGVWLV